jgi:uncharacterized membrane protein (DUF2068 family)
MKNFRTGLKAVAVFEACKGSLVMLEGIAAFSLIHRNIQSLADQLVNHMHLNPAKHIPRIFAEAAANITDSRLIFFAFLALLYAFLRFIEAYGLWMGRKWAEWFALLSGGVYLPIELFELSKGFTWMKFTFAAVNLAVVFYLGYVLVRNGALNRPEEQNFKTGE